MAQPVPYSPSTNFQSELGTQLGTNLDAEFNNIRTTVDETLVNLALIQRDDGYIRNQTVTADAFSSDALALMAGSASNPDVDWLPRGEWVTATLYEVGNIIETGSPATAYVCAVQHVSAATFAADYASNYWVVLSAPRTLISADIVSALGYTPLNKAGDTMTGQLTIGDGQALAFTTAGVATITQELYATQQLLTLSNAGLYSQQVINFSAIAYGFAANVYRFTGLDPNYTVGIQANAYAEAPGVTSGTWGGSFEAWAANGANAYLCGIEPSIINRNPSHTAALRGIDVVFKDRADGQTAVSAGLGANQYNQGAVGLYISSQTRSTVGEYCGFRFGIRFAEDALDRDAVGLGVGIDFSPVRYYGGTDPVTAYRGMTAAIAMRDFQSIWWNRDPTVPGDSGSQIRTYFDSTAARWKLTNTGIERFGVDVATGVIYSNGVPIGGGVSLSGNNTWTGTNTFNNSVAIGSNLAFTGAARRITGDFTNATLASRTLFQTSTVGGATYIGALPAAAGTDAGFYSFALPDPDNSAYLLLAAGSTVSMDINRTGAGSAVSFELRQQGVAALTVATTGEALFAQHVRRKTGAFLVNKNLDMSINTATFTKVTLNVEQFDLDGWFNTGTNRYTPLIAGVYNFSAAVEYGASVDSATYYVMIYKNGTLVAQSSGMSAGTSDVVGASVSVNLQANGSTDFFEMYTYQNSGATESLSSATTTAVFFSGHHVG